MSKDITVGGLCEPDLEGIQVGTCGGVWVCGWSAWPKVLASSQRLLELERSINLLVVLDWSDTTLISTKISSGLDVSVAVVANIEEVLAAGWQASLDISGPGLVLIHISGGNSVCSTSGSVNV